MEHLVKLILISDTHGRYQPSLPEGDILIHAGDLSMDGDVRTIFRSIEWLGSHSSNYQRILAVAGNHDFFAEKYPATVTTFAAENGVLLLFDDTVTYEGYTFHGSPVAPWHNNWAFGPHRGPEIKKHWDLIPDDVDVLITHGPPARVLDSCPTPVGCEDLLDRVKEVKPQLHIFGHIHEGRGEMELPGLRTRFINASMLTPYYTPAGDPFTFTLEEKTDA